MTIVFAPGWKWSHFRTYRKMRLSRVCLIHVSEKLQIVSGHLILLATYLLITVIVCLGCNGMESSFVRYLLNSSIRSFFLCSVDILKLNSFPIYLKDSSNTTAGILWLFTSKRGLY